MAGPSSLTLSVQAGFAVGLSSLTLSVLDGSVGWYKSIKPNTSGLPYSQSADRPDGVAFVNERLRDVMLFAFGLHDFQLAGAPAWVSRDRFDIMARADAPLSTDEKRARLRPTSD